MHSARTPKLNVLSNFLPSVNRNNLGRPSVLRFGIFLTVEILVIRKPIYACLRVD